MARILPDETPSSFETPEWNIVRFSDDWTMSTQIIQQTWDDVYETLRTPEWNLYKLYTDWTMSTQIIRQK